MSAVRLFNKELVLEAIAMLEPSILRQMELGNFKRKVLAIVVCNPQVLHGSIAEAAFAQEAVTCTHVIGNPGDATSFKEFALAKAKLSWKHRMSTSMIQQCFPHLIPDRGLLYYGSVWRDGQVVAASGAQPFFDEMVSGWVADAIRALSIEERQNPELAELAYLPG